MTALGENRFIQKIRIQNALSFGPDSPEIELKSLNVLIGPNGCGKSNFIEMLNLLRQLPHGDPSAVLPREMKADDESSAVPEGAAAEWLWRGKRTGFGERNEMKLNLTVAPPASSDSPDNLLRHRIALRAEIFGRYFLIEDETIEYVTAPDENFYYRDHYGHPVINRKVQQADGSFAWGTLEPDTRAGRESAIRKWGRDDFPEIAYLSALYGGVTIHQETTFGRGNPFRRPQSISLNGERLMEDGENLNLILNNLRGSDVWERIVSALRDFYEPVRRLETKASYGNIEIFLREEGFESPIPAARLSDGTLRYLYLITILCQADPPPLICIEEPELGLHPDIIPTLAKLLIDASRRTQLVVTTHSKNLVDCFSDAPDAVLVCSKQAGSTTIKRLDLSRIKKWLDKYSLGTLWAKGEIGGNRW
jgi:predicted ATPase